MTTCKKIGVLIVLCSVVAVCISQESQGGAHESQGGAHESQGGIHESQGGAHESQGGAHESQGGAHESQGGEHESQASAHESQGGAHEIQGRVRRQVSQGLVDWVSCDFTAPTKVSCHDCNTRVICKPIGGVLKPCSPKKPFCNNGLCSAVPSSDCA